MNLARRAKRRKKPGGIVRCLLRGIRIRIRKRNWRSTRRWSRKRRRRGGISRGRIWGTRGPEGRRGGGARSRVHGCGLKAGWVTPRWRRKVAATDNSLQENLGGAF